MLHHHLQLRKFVLVGLFYHPLHLQLGHLVFHRQYLNLYHLFVLLVLVTVHLFRHLKLQHHRRRLDRPRRRHRENLGIRQVGSGPYVAWRR